MKSEAKFFEITAYGHQNILSNHKTTLQVTKDLEITKRADCIIGVNADKSTSELPEWLKMHLNSRGKILFTIIVDGLKIKGEAQGHPNLTFESHKDIVFRRSSFISDRTIAINSNLSAIDLSIEMKEKLKDRNTKLKIIIQLVK